MAVGSGNWTWENESSSDCDSSGANTTWLDAQLYPGLVVDRSVSPVWYLVGVTGTT